MYYITYVRSHLSVLCVQCQTEMEMYLGTKNLPVGGKKISWNNPDASTILKVKSGWLIIPENSVRGDV